MIKKWFKTFYCVITINICIAYITMKTWWWFYESLENNSNKLLKNFKIIFRIIFFDTFF